MGKIVYQVSPEWEDLRIDKYLTEQSEQLSRSYIQKLIKEGHLYVNDQMCRSSYKVKEDDVISFDVPENTTLQVEAEDIPLDILYEDEEMIVVNKPADMPIHTSQGNYINTLGNAIMAHFPNQNFVYHLLFLH